MRISGRLSPILKSVRLMALTARSASPLTVQRLSIWEQCSPKDPKLRFFTHMKSILSMRFIPLSLSQPHQHRFNHGLKATDNSLQLFHCCRLCTEPIGGRQFESSPMESDDCGRSTVEPNIGRSIETRFPRIGPKCQHFDAMQRQCRTDNQRIDRNGRLGPQE